MMHGQQNIKNAQSVLIWFKKMRPNKLLIIILSMKQILIWCSGRILLNLYPNMTFMVTWYF